MITDIFKTPRTRFAVSFYMAAIMIAIFALLRVALLIKAWHVIDHNIFELIHIFGQGFIYDMAFIGYFQIPFVILLLVIPDKWLNHFSLRMIALGICFLIIYGLCFGFVAEWFFWNEFGVRFNFISIDYLIYRREVDTISRNVTQNDSPLNLTAKEFSILEFLLHNKGSVVSRFNMAEHVWGSDFDPFSMSNFVDVHIKNLRFKLNARKEASIIRTVRGIGFIIDDTP